MKACVRRTGVLAAVALAVGLIPTAAWAAPATVLYNDSVFDVAQTLADPDDLWVSPSDLMRISGFALEGNKACLKDLCVPAAPESDIRVQRSSRTWISVTELARQLRQAVAVDAERGIWSFGEIPATRTGFLDNAMAPDFTLETREGKSVSLSDFRGKKVLIVTWASW